MPNKPYYMAARSLTSLAYVCLLAIIFYDIWQSDLQGTLPKLVLWVLTTSGLWLVFPGLLRQTRRSYQWLCFILLMYFIWYVQSAFSGPGKSGAEQLEAVAATHELAALAAIVLGFCAGMFAARGRS